MGRVKFKADWGPKGALALPKALMEHQDFRELSPSATKVLMVLGCQYNGRNNGDLAATKSMLKSWGGMADGTLARALRQLKERNLILCTRTSYRRRDGQKCALYALTWMAIDQCPGKELEVKDTIVPKRRLR
jgi:hypothetical protein